jgi:hypothetical protein
MCPSTVSQPLPPLACSLKLTSSFLYFPRDNLDLHAWNHDRLNESARFFFVNFTCDHLSFVSPLHSLPQVLPSSTPLSSPVPAATMSNRQLARDMQVEFQARVRPDSSLQSQKPAHPANISLSLVPSEAGQTRSPESRKAGSGPEEADPRRQPALPSIARSVLKFLRF